MAVRNRVLVGALVAVTAMAFGMVVGLPAEAAVWRVTLVSTSAAGVGSDSVSFSASVSGDGTLVAFASKATNLDPLDPNPASDIYVKNVTTGAVELVSVSLAGGGAGASYEPAISADGRYVAFRSSSPNIMAGDANGAVTDVFVRDLRNNTTVLASRNNSGDQADQFSEGPTISGDGRYVAFISAGSNMPDTGASAGQHDIYLRDLVAGTTVRVSSDATNPAAGGNSWSYLPDISDDGRFVAYESYADNLLTTPDTNGTGDVFWWDRLGLSPTVRVSVAGRTTEGNAQSRHPSISANGRYVAFYSSASNFGGTGTQVYVRDVTTQTTEQVSKRTQGVPANDDSDSPSISGDGRYVAFTSDATNLVANDTNATTDVFLRDRVTKTTTRVSLTDTRAEANESCRYPAISADGSHVAFSSGATNLVADDTNRSTDVFIGPAGDLDSPSPTRRPSPIDPTWTWTSRPVP